MNVVILICTFSLQIATSTETVPGSQGASTSKAPPLPSLEMDDDDDLRLLEDTSPRSSQISSPTPTASLQASRGKSKMPSSQLQTILEKKLLPAIRNPTAFMPPVPSQWNSKGCQRDISYFNSILEATSNIKSIYWLKFMTGVNELVEKYVCLSESSNTNVGASNVVNVDNSKVVSVSAGDTTTPQRSIVTSLSLTPNTDALLENFETIVTTSLLNTPGTETGVKPICPKSTAFQPNPPPNVTRFPGPTVSASFPGPTVSASSTISSAPAEAAASVSNTSVYELYLCKAYCEKYGIDTSGSSVMVSADLLRTIGIDIPRGSQGKIIFTDQL